MCCHLSRASRTSAGLPNASPRNSSSESAPITRASVCCSATALALAAASSATFSATRGASTRDSSTWLMTTSGASPACLSRLSRAGEALPSTSRRGSLMRPPRWRSSAAYAAASLVRMSSRARSCEPARRAPAARTALQRTAVALGVRRPGPHRRRPPPRAPLRQRRHDDGEGGELLGRGLPGHHPEQGQLLLLTHRGMFPCFFGGSDCRLLASTRSALVTCAL